MLKKALKNFRLPDGSSPSLPEALEDNEGQIKGNKKVQLTA